MSIVLSAVIEDRAQIDGRRWVREHHTDHLGVVHVVTYLAEALADAASALAARVPGLEADLAASEVARDLSAIYAGDYAAVTAQHVTLANLRAAIRSAYQTARGEQVGRLAGWLLTLTDAQLRTLFAMSQAQVDALKVRLAARVVDLTAVLNAAGE